MSNQHTEADQYAVLSIPAAEGHSQKREVTCLFEGLDGKRLSLEAQERPPVSSVVSIEFHDALFLGEVVRVAPANRGTWRVEVKVEQILNGLQSLVNLRARLLGEPTVSPARQGQTSFSLCA